MKRVTRSPLRPGVTLLRGAILGLMGLVLAGGAVAELEVHTIPTNNGGQADLRIEEGTILLSLEEAVEIALKQNLTLAIERYNRQQFRLGIEGEKGIFDLRLAAYTDLNSSTSPSASELEGADIVESETQNANVGLYQLTPIGGDLGLVFNNQRSQTNSAFFDLNPSYTSSLALTFNLPLLRDFGILPTRRGLLTARLQSDGNREFFEEQVVSIIQQVENAYWDLVEAIDQLGVAQEGLRLAQELHRRNRIQVDVGTLPPLELVQSEATIATREEEIISARTVVGDTADRLRLLLNLQQGPAWDAEITPETDPKTDIVEITLDEAIAGALAQRPELARQRLVVERLDIDRRFARNQVLPSVDLALSYGFSGLGGDLRTETGETIPGGWSDAFEQVRNGDFEGWSASLNIAYPFQNRAARAQRAQARLELEKGRSQLLQLEQQVLTEVRTAVRQVTAAAQQIESAGVSRRLQERNLEAEQKRYENGMSTSFQITQIQDDLTRAKSREVTAIASYRRALTEYYRVVGRLLGETGVSLLDPGE